MLVDWLPWNHVFGGSHNVGIALYNGGTLHIDDGRPTPGGMAETITNLRQISPTFYFNVPKGFEELATAMDTDEVLRRSLFAKVRAFDVRRRRALAGGVGPFDRQGSARSASASPSSPASA